MGPTTTTTRASTTTTTATTTTSTEHLAASCYGELNVLAEDEGDSVGQAVSTSSADQCKKSCSQYAECQSFSLCPQWNMCWMKTRVVDGGESTKDLGECRTYFKRSCGITATATATTTITTTKTTTGI